MCASVDNLDFETRINLLSCETEIPLKNQINIHI